MSTEFDTRSSAPTSHDSTTDTVGPVPGKHTNTELAANGGGGPMPAVPGKRSSTEGLPDAEPPGAKTALSAMARAFGQSFDDVRLHVGKVADERTAALNTKAFTTGKDIYFARGAFDPESTEGKRVLAHELTHVVQQRGALAQAQGFSEPVGERGNAFEQEAHRAAGDVAAGNTPEVALSTSSAVAMRDEEPVKLTQPEYLKKYTDQIATHVIARMSTLDVDTQSPFAIWKDGALPFVGAAITSMANNHPAFISALYTLCAPESPSTMIDRARHAGNDGKSEDRWEPDVAVEIRNVLARRITESLGRAMPRYVKATNQVFLSAVGPLVKPADINNPTEPQLADVIASAPIDKHVIPALFGKVKVDLKNYQTAHPNDKAEPKPRTVNYTFAAQTASSASESKLNWIQVTDVCDPPVTVEDVAQSIYGGSEYASLITPAPPLFGFSNPEKLLRYEAWKKLPGNTAATDPNNLAFDPDKADPAKQLLAGGDADNAIKGQAKGAPGTDKGAKEDVAARMRAMMLTVSGITADVKGIAGITTAGLEALGKRLDDRSKKVMATVVNADNAQNQWDGQSHEQLKILGACAGATKTAGESWAQMVKGGGKEGPASYFADPVRKLAKAFVDVAEVSDLTETASGRLAAANVILEAYPIDVLEGLLSYSHELIRMAHTTIFVGAGSWDVAQSGKTTEGLEAKERELRQGLAGLRDKVGKNPGAALAELKKFQEQVKELQMYASIVALLARGGDLQNTLYNLGQGTLANKDWSKLWHPLDESKQTGSKRRKYDQASAQLGNLRNELVTKVITPGKSGDLKTAYDNLPAIQTKYQELFPVIDALLVDEEAKEKWIKIGLIIGISIMSAGLADAALAVGVASMGMEAGTAGALAFKTGLEAGAFTALSQATIEKDPSLQGAMSEFIKNWATFAIVGKAMKSYEVALPAFSKTGAGQVVAVSGMFVAHCSAGLAAADAKKFLATGQHLSEHEATDAIEEAFLVTIGTIIGERVTLKFLHGIKFKTPELNRKVAEVNSQRDSSKADAAKLTSGKAKVEEGEAALKKDGGTIDKEKEIVDELETMKKKDPNALKNEGLSDKDVGAVDAAKAGFDASAAKNKLLQQVLGMKSLGGGNNFACSDEQMFAQIVKEQREAGSTVSVSKDEVTQHQVAVITTAKGETIRIIEDPHGSVVAKDHVKPVDAAQQQGTAAALAEKAKWANLESKGSNGYVCPRDKIRETALGLGEIKKTTIDPLTTAVSYEVKLPDGRTITITEKFSPAADWIAQLRGELSPEGKARLEGELQTKTPQDVMDQFKGNLEGAAKELGAITAKAEPDTIDMYGSGTPPKDPNAKWKFKDNPLNWKPERRALHIRLISEAMKHAQAFADAVKTGEPTIFAMRGNTAAGKTRAVSNNVPDLKDPMAQTKDLAMRSVNPDNFKAALIEASGGSLTSSQVHAESSMLSDQLEVALKGMKTSDGKQLGSILIDKRLASVGDVQHYAALAKSTGRKFVLYDVDAPIEVSLAGVLERNPGGADPLPPFDIVGNGFKAVRMNRQPVVDLFMADGGLGTYEIYGTKPNGDRVPAATVSGGTLTIHDPVLYKEVMGGPDAATGLADKIITSESIDAVTSGLEGDRKIKVGNLLRKYQGWTWKAALDAHAKEKPLLKPTE